MSTKAKEFALHNQGYHGKLGAKSPNEADYQVYFWGGQRRVSKANHMEKLKLESVN